MTMQITFLGLFFGLLLAGVPVYAIYRYRLDLLQPVIKACVRAVVFTGLLAILLWAAVSLNSIVFDLLSLVIVAVVSTALTLHKARLRMSQVFLPLAVATLLAASVTGFYTMFLVMGMKNPFLPHVFVPVMALFSFCMIEANAKALQRYYMGLTNSNQLYYYLLGNGATHREALDYFVRRCLQSSIIAVTKQLSRLAGMTAPVVMLVLVMCKVNVPTAFVFQLLLYVIVLATSILTLLGTLYLARRSGFDKYERLKPPFKAKPQTAPSENSSANPEAPQHIDSESLTPEE